MKKNAITIIASEETYQNLSTFTDIEELNKTVRQYKEKFHDKLTRSTMAILDQLHRYSVKFLGVSFRTKNHIARSLNISRQTVIRACKVLEDLGIIKQLEMKRQSDMRQTSNAIVIQEIEENVTQACTKTEEKCNTKKTTSSLKQVINNKRTNELDSTFTSSNVPKEFITLVGKFYDSASIVEELWKCVTVSKYRESFDSQTVLTIALESFKQLIPIVKRQRVKRSVYALFWGILKRKLQMHWLHSTFDSYLES